MTARRSDDATLVRALIFDSYMSDHHWVYRWRQFEWGARGVAHFFGPDPPARSCRRVMQHILDRLEIDSRVRAPPAGAPGPGPLDVEPGTVLGGSESRGNRVRGGGMIESAGLSR